MTTALRKAALPPSASTSERLRELVDAGMALSSEPSLDGILERLLETAARLTDARYAALGVIDPSGSGLERFITHGIDVETKAAIGSPPEGRGVLGVLLHELQPLRLAELSRDPRSVGFPPNHPPMHSFLGAPIRLRSSVFGNLYLTEKAGGAEFTSDDQEVATVLAAQAAIAIELSQRVARDTLRRVVAAQETERRRLARELHDETGQALASLLLGLRSLEVDLPNDATRAAVAELRELTVATLQDVRRLAVELRPKALDDFGLAAALERLAETWQEATGIALTFTAHLGDERLPDELATAFYRIVQEALTNVVKHGHAHRVSILLTRQNGNVVAIIEDDGRGFDPSEPIDGFGLEGMRERVALLHGRLQIESSPEAGTTIVVEAPLQ